MKQLSLRFKLYALVVSLLLIMGISIVVTAQLSLGAMEKRMTVETRDTVQGIVMDQLGATAGKYGELVSGQFATAFRTPEVVSNVITRNIQSDSSGRISRSALQETIGAVLEEQESLSSIYAQFEPDGYDGQDRYFTGGVEEHSSDEGTLEIYYYRDPDGNVVFSRTEDPSVKYLDGRNEYGIREAEWYLCSRDTKAPCIMEPYEYEISEGYSELMTSLVVPIVDGDTFAGVTGVDINLSTLQKTIGGVSQELFDGKSRVTLISEQGLIAASSHYEAHLGRPLQEALPEHGDTFSGWWDLR
jgi:methyl-accepting chemotaxis protein